MPLHLGLNSHSHSQEATREARRLLQQKVRNDWDYPLAPHPNTHQSAEATVTAIATTTTATATAVDAKATVAQHSSAAAAAAAAALDFQAVAWREREYSENESSASEDEGASGGSSNSKTDPKRKQETVAERKQSRKRRRMNALEEEMGWNIGLANYSAQRNAWTGARTGKTQQEKSDVDMDADNTSPPLQQSSNDDLSQRPPAIAEDATVSLPVAPRLLPDNPVRAIISPSSYAEIYTKVILQGRTPTVPINLQDVTNAMVQGWKEEGNWPPKVAAPEPSIAASAANKKKAATTTTDGRGATPSGGNNNSNQKHPHFSKGVHAVAKVLHNLTSGPLDSPRHRNHA